MVNMAKRAGLPWDCILGAETARAYKPMPQAYLVSLPSARPAAGAGDDGRRAQRRPESGERRRALRPPSCRAPPSMEPGRKLNLTADPQCVDLAVAAFQSSQPDLAAEAQGGAAAVQLGIAAFAAVALFFAVNWLYQVVRKPAELFFPVSGALNKAPAETWRQVRADFPRAFDGAHHCGAAGRASPSRGRGQPGGAHLLALRLTREPFDVYKPASSAVGMYQITDGTSARRSNTAFAATPWSRTGPGTTGSRVVQQPVPARGAERALLR